jgi:hypothetical protein
MKDCSDQIRIVTSVLFLLSFAPAMAAGQQPSASSQPLTATPGEPPVVPSGLDAYRQWERWPYQRLGVRAYMRSTYDRRGGNESADASHFLYQKADDFNVSLDIAGPGILYFARYNHWHGSPWHYVVDGADHIVQESSTADPAKPVENSVFLPREALLNPLTWTWSDTKGADLMWAPVMFEKSFQMAYSRTRYGTGYYIYHQFAPGTKLSQPIKAWDGKTSPDRDVLNLIGRAGTDVAPVAGRHVKQQGGRITVPATNTVTIATIDEAPAMLRALEVTVAKEHAIALGRARLRVTWDNRPQPSIDAPVALFYGAGTLYNRDNREYLVKAFPVHIHYDGPVVRLACYFPMPFFQSAKIELVGTGIEVPGVQWRLRYAPYDGPANHIAYFHATYRDHSEPVPGKDLVLLDTRQAEGGGDWSGHFIGTSFIFSHNAVLNTLEGDPRFFFDDSNTPQAYGTGTEEWAGGGDYWGGRNMTLPFAGHPTGASNAKEAKDPQDLIQSAYRFLLADLMPFGLNARICLEHGGTNQSREHYETVTYWYGAPSATLVKTDELQIGDAANEQAHHYQSPGASAPYQITSRYEWGVDRIGNQEAYPAHTDTARKTTGSSEFTLKLEPNNFGVLLRRKLDYAYPNQRAEVFIADVSRADDPAAWVSAGIWYTAGSNTCVYSDPTGELGATAHEVQTSNRRFRDDEFLIGREHTRGRSAIRLRMTFTPVDIPLFPGWPKSESAWTEIRYTAYDYVMPSPQPGASGNADNVAYIGKSDANGNPVRLAKSTGHVSNYSEEKVAHYTLPDPLVTFEGQRITTAEQWNTKRRPEVLKFYQDEIYGRVPKNSPSVTWQVAETDTAARGGTAILKRVVGAIGDSPNAPRMNLLVYLPAKVEQPAPVLLNLTFGFPAGARRSGAAGRPGAGVARGRALGGAFDPAAEVLSRGWGYASLGYNEIQPDRADRWSEGVIGQTLSEGQFRPAPDEWGTISAWAWGASRAIDYLQTDKAVDPKQIAITGASRLGKTALWAGAQDQRIAAVFAVVPGEMGASLIRRDWGETLDDMAQNFDWQFAGNLQKWVGKWNDLPVDQHLLIALCAPRPVYVNGGLSDQWSDPKGEFLALVSTGPVYRLLGGKDLGVRDLPPLDQPITSGDLAFHYHSRGHTAVPEDWKAFLDFAERHFRSMSGSASSNRQP